MSRSLKRRLIDAAWAFAADLQYRSDGLATAHAAEFLNDQRFAAAYREGVSTNPGFGRNLHVEWRIFICCWAAQQAILHGADLVECGVNTGLNALSVARYLQLDIAPSVRYYLLDTFCGIPEEQSSAQERRGTERYNTMYRDCYEEVVATFAPFSSVKLIRGTIPATLSQVDSEHIGYLSVDLNIAYPEKALLEYFWDRLISGAIVVLDDYGWNGHELQRSTHDEFARNKGVMVLPLPTGQGLILKP